MGDDEAAGWSRSGRRSGASGSGCARSRIGTSVATTERRTSMTRVGMPATRSRWAVAESASGTRRRWSSTRQGRLLIRDLRARQRRRRWDGPGVGHRSPGARRRGQPVRLPSRSGSRERREPRRHRVRPASRRPAAVVGLHRWDEPALAARRRGQRRRRRRAAARGGPGSDAP